MMKKFKRILALMLSVSMATYALPGYSMGSVEEDAVLTDLTDKQLEAAVGAGNVDATVADYRTNGQAVAVFSNRSLFTVDYSLDALDSGGNVIENLASGVMGPDQSLLVTGNQTVSGPRIVRATLGGTLVLRAEDTSWGLF